MSEEMSKPLDNLSGAAVRGELAARAATSADTSGMARVDGSMSRAQAIAAVCGEAVVDVAEVDKHLDAVLRASGSALHYFSMQKVIGAMRNAMIEAMRSNAVQVSPRAADAPSEPTIPEGYALVPAAASADEIVSRLYRRFKDWAARGFGPDDVTWCEVKADVLAMIAELSGVAADMPSDLLSFSAEGDLMQELEDVLIEKNWRADLVKRIRKSRAADAPSDPTDLSKHLRKIVAECRTVTAQVMVKDITAAAAEIERYYGGMMAWKLTAEQKDADWNTICRAADALDSQPTDLPEECSDEMYFETTHICNLLEREDVNAMWRAMRKVVIDSRAPAAQAASVGKWISVHDELPEHRQTVAFVVDTGDWTRMKHLNGRVLGGQFDESTGNFSAPGLGVMATHWMPLPPAPQQEGSEAGNG